MSVVWLVWEVGGNGWWYVAFTGEESGDGGRSVVGDGVVGSHWEYYTCIVYPALMKWALLRWVWG